MSDKNHEKQMYSFIATIRQQSAARILELGTIDESFIAEMLRQFDWSDSVVVHCVDNGSSTFDASLTKVVEGRSLDVKVIKHVGSETEVNDAVMKASEQSFFDAIFISSAPSAESMLTACMVSNECLKPGGVIGMATSLIDDELMSVAISSFRDIYIDSYDEVDQHLFVKKAS